VRRFIVTGAPGAGKTSALLALPGLAGTVVPEAATQIIAREQAAGVAEPWTRPEFIDRIVLLQRELQAAATGQTQLFDRSPVCTLALQRYLGHPTSEVLTAELDRIQRERIYQPEVFFVRPLGFIEPTAARRISYADSLEFERLHEQAYGELGYTLIDVPAMPVAQRAALIVERLRAPFDPAGGSNGARGAEPV
jgi:predicted ATPase